MKHKEKYQIIFGKKVFHNSRKTSFLAVGNTSKKIIINKNKFNQYPKEIQYFFIRWALHKVIGKGKYRSNEKADSLALKDYVKKKYLLKPLAFAYPKILNENIDTNYKRILEFFTAIKKHNKKREGGVFRRKIK